MDESTAVYRRIRDNLLVRYRAPTYLPGVDVNGIIGVAQTGVFDEVLEVRVTLASPALSVGFERLFPR
jgi:hypothetical protein